MRRLALALATVGLLTTGCSSSGQTSDSGTDASLDGGPDAGSEGQAGCPSCDSGISESGIADWGVQDSVLQDSVAQDSPDDGCDTSNSCCCDGDVVSLPMCGQGGALVCPATAQLYHGTDCAPTCGTPCSAPCDAHGQ